MPNATGPLIIHASTVRFGPNAVIILGASGSGKSSFALKLLAYGCELVADDRTLITATDSALFAAAPDALKGLIEARGVGILKSPVSAAPARLVCAVLLDETEKTRLPEPDFIEFSGVKLRLFRKPVFEAFPEAILHYLKHEMLL